MAVLEEAVEDAVTDLHGGAEDDRDILEGHLVERRPRHDVDHVDEDPLQQQPVALGQLPEQRLHPLDALSRRRVRRDLFEPEDSHLMTQTKTNDPDLIVHKKIQNHL